MFHHDLAHIGYSTSTAPATNQVLWSYTTGDDVWSSPAIADGKVYVGSRDNKVYAFGSPPGPTPTPTPTPTATPTPTPSPTPTATPKPQTIQLFPTLYYVIIAVVVIVPIVVVVIVLKKRKPSLPPPPPPPSF